MVGSTSMLSPDYYTAKHMRIQTVCLLSDIAYEKDFEYV